MASILVHVGFPKTATTSLQQGVFSRSDRIAHLGKTSSLPGRAFREALEAVIRTPADRLDAPGLRGVLIPEIERIEEAGRAVVISHESFTHPWHSELSTAPLRIERTLGAGRILVTIRDQRSWLQSIYLYYARKAAFRGTAVAADVWFAQEAAKGVRGMIAAGDFAATVEAFVASVGRDNVEVLPLERLAADPQAYFGRLGRFAGVAPDHLVALYRDAPHLYGRPSERLMRLARLNRTVRAMFGTTAARTFGQTQNRLLKPWFRHGRPAAAALPGWLAAELADRYGPGNRRLAERFDLPELSGYPGVGADAAGMGTGATAAAAAAVLQKALAR